ncbi:hypothetical protein MCOR29_000382 [Pyricularia oryzae]|nr:hypothetical protein MCOR29_000382 [Pyricularia oryzae]KAI6397068.1 hypothetical protein MCOR23_006308 [Pyricularia oryzae]
MAQGRKRTHQIPPVWFLSLLPAALALPRLTSECPAGFKGRLDSPGYTQCAVPTDDASGPHPSQWAPWTHKPLCVEGAAPKTQPSGGSDDGPSGTTAPPPWTKFCVYTNAHAGDGGMSIITTPEHAASSLHLLEDPSLHLPSSSSSSSRLHNASTTPAYKVVDVPGKGKGVLATRRIRRFEPFMLERAALATDNLFASLVERHVGYRLLREAVGRLADPDRVLSLARSNPHAGDAVENVLRTNSFAGELDGAPHMVLFPLIARMNHACKPKYPRTTKTFSYSPDAALGMEFQQRQTQLQNTWGFKCTCAACTAPESSRAVSDQRRRDIRAKRQELVDSIDNADAPVAVRLSLEILDLLASEHLPSLFAEQYEILARIFHMIRYKDKAVKYAEMALKVLDIYGALDEDDEHKGIEALMASFDRPSLPAMGERPK